MSRTGTDRFVNKWLRRDYIAGSVKMMSRNPLCHYDKLKTTGVSSSIRGAKGHVSFQQINTPRQIQSMSAAPMSDPRLQVSYINNYLQSLLSADKAKAFKLILLRSCTPSVRSHNQSQFSLWHLPLHEKMKFVKNHFKPIFRKGFS